MPTPHYTAKTTGRDSMIGWLRLCLVSLHWPVRKAGADQEFRRGWVCAQSMANGNLQAMLELVVEIMSSFVKIMILPIFTEKWNGNLLNKNFEWINVLWLKYDWLQMWINEMQWNEIVWTFFYIYGWYFGLSRNFTTTNTNDNNHNANK